MANTPPETKIKDLLSDAAKGRLNNEMRDRIQKPVGAPQAEKDKELTLGDVWRLSGWFDANRGDVNVDPRTAGVKMEDFKSFAEACAERLRELGIRGISYQGTYSCCCCTLCCAVVVPPKPK